MLSKGRITVEQETHRDKGTTTDSFLGNRWIHTFAKLPIISPKLNTVMVTS